MSAGAVQALAAEKATASVVARRSREQARAAAGRMADGSGRRGRADLAELASLLEPGDIIIDGGNSYYVDDIRRAKELGQKRIDYVDVGTSGGVWGLERGYCMMIGGPDAT